MNLASPLHDLTESLASPWLTPRPAPCPADKLAQTKNRERELKEAHRRELQVAKDAGAARRQEQHLTLKEERTLHDTKRAAKDKRDVRLIRNVFGGGMHRKTHS